MKIKVWKLSSRNCWRWSNFTPGNYWHGEADTWAQAFDEAYAAATSMRAEATA